MDAYIAPMLSGLSLISIALASMLSALIRLVQTMQLRQRVAAGHAGVRELSELSGILDPRDLQDIFGPPSINRIWPHVTEDGILRKRRFPGILMSEPRLHWATIFAAVMALGLVHWITEFLLILAALAQLGAWLSATRLPK